VTAPLKDIVERLEPPMQRVHDLAVEHGASLERARRP
jgi:hypothetical protein